MNKYNLKMGDEIGRNMGDVILKVTSKFCWFVKKRYSWDYINELIEKIGYIRLNNEDVEIDWTSKEAVIEYYNSFRFWKFDMLPIETKKEDLKFVEVKDNLVFFDNEYWIPFKINDSSKIEIPNGWYHVLLIKRKYYPYKFTVNNFLVE
jgi:hypothetical protein